jgi:hypothetical protein
MDVYTKILGGPVRSLTPDQITTNAGSTPAIAPAPGAQARNEALDALAKAKQALAAGNQKEADKQFAILQSKAATSAQQSAQAANTNLNNLNTEYNVAKGIQQAGGVVVKGIQQAGGVVLEGYAKGANAVSAVLDPVGTLAQAQADSLLRKYGVIGPMIQNPVVDAISATGGLVDAGIRAPVMHTLLDDFAFTPLQAVSR